MTAPETIRIETPAGPKLAGILHHPRVDDNAFGVVVAHGMLSSKDSDKHRMICEAAASFGATIPSAPHGASTARGSSSTVVPTTLCRPRRPKCSRRQTRKPN